MIKISKPHRTVTQTLSSMTAVTLVGSCLLACTTHATPVANTAPVIVVGEPNKTVVLKDKPNAEPNKNNADAERVKKLEQALNEATEFGILGVIGGPDAGGSIFGGSAFGGSGQTSTLGGPVGVLSGTGGFGGLGLKGVGIGGGGTGEGIGGLGTLGTLGTGGALGSITTYGHGSGGSYYGGERPKAKIDTATIQGPLPPEIVQRVLNDHREDFQDCYVLEASRGGRPRGKLSLAFTINNNGRVTEVRAPESTLTPRDLQACIAQAVGSFEFPAPKSTSAETTEVRVLVPISF